MSNFANLYAYIKSTNQTIDISYNVQISYIKTLTGSNSNVLFIYKTDDTKMRYKNSNPVENIRNSDRDLDLTGSPLKDDCEIDAIDLSFEMKMSLLTPWSAIEEQYTGININHARTILNDYDLQMKYKECCDGALWILCDGSDQQKTILLHVNFNQSWNIRGCVVYQGMMPTNDINCIEMINAHNMKIQNANKIEFLIDNYFIIKSNTTLKFTWITSSIIPNLNDYKNSDVTLYQTIKIDDPSSVAEYFWRQLYILSLITDSIVDYKENDDTNRELVYKCGSGINMDTLREKVLAIITELPGFYDIDNTTCNIEMEAVVQRVKKRDSIDLTDKLWEVLKNCSSYKDLKNALNFVFYCAGNYNIVNMPTNQNRLAEIIREVSQHRLAIPCLSGSEPMELLLEIGLEKISKDYEFIFIESQICGSKDLQLHNCQSIKSSENSFKVRRSLHNALETNISAKKSTPTERMTLLHSRNAQQTEIDKNFIGFQNSTFNKKEIIYKLSKLTQIHLILEHLLQIQINLNLDNVYNQICKELLQVPVKSFDQIRDKIYDKIQIPIITDKILPQIENKDPHARRIVMKSENKFRKLESTFYYNMENIFPPNIFSGLQIDNKELTKENLYHCWNYTKYATKRC